MDAYRDLSFANDLLFYCPDEFCKLSRKRVADSIGDIQYGSAFVNGCFEDGAEKIDITPRRILGRKLDVLGVVSRHAYRVSGHLQNFVTSFPQLVLKMNVRGSNKRMYPRASGFFECLRRPQNILLGGPAQCRDLCGATFPRYGPHGAEIAFRSD